MLFKNKKGADASSAAALIAIIGFLIILYILFIPPEERAKLIGDDEDGDGIIDSQKELKILLSESPQRLFPAEKREFEQSFSALNIYVGEEAVKLKEVENLYSSRSLFTKRKVNVTFEVSDIVDLQSTLLNFYVDESKGRLLIYLNGEEIYNKKLEEENIKPIKLQEKIRRGDNTLTFEVSSPRLMFWRKNEYSLDDLLITADVLKKETQEATLTFIVDETEKQNLKKVKLRYLPECVEKDVGPLTISVNNYNLYSGTPADCNILAQPIEFLPDRLNIGENTLKFSTTDGWYLIDNIRLSSELKKPVIPVYYFEIEDEDYNGVKNLGDDMFLYMKFVDDVTRKVADITINNHLIRLDQNDDEFNVTINKLIEKGNNALKIEADEILDITKLEIQLES